ncbi:unnamed protein product, partial [Prorocentrum cordatum]
MSGDGAGAPPPWRRRAYWVCPCKEWNWCDKRATCKSSGEASRAASAASTAPSSAPNSRVRPRGGTKPPPWREEREEQPEEPASSLERRLEGAQARVSSLREAVAMGGTSEAFQREARAALLAAERAAERAEAELREAQQLGRPPHAVLHGGANAMQKVEKQITATRAKRDQAVQRAEALRGEIAAKQEELAEVESAVEDFNGQLGKLEESKAQTVQQALQRAIEVCGGKRPLETAVGGLVMQVNQLGEMLGRSSEGVAPGLLEIMDIITTQSAAISDMLRPAAPAASAARWADGLGGDGLAVDVDEEGPPAPAPGATGPPGQAERKILVGARDEHEDCQARADGGGIQPSDVAAVCPVPTEQRGLRWARVSGAEPAGEKAAVQLRAGFDVLGLNGNTWDRAMEVLEAYIARKDERPHLVTVQEVRLGPRQLENARRRARGLGYAAFLHAAAPTGQAALAHSGGVGVLVRDDLQAREAQWRVPGDFRHRMVAVRVASASGLQFLACSLYLQDGLGPKGVNLDIIGGLGDLVLTEGLPWLVQGDFNMEPGTLYELGWPALQRGAYLGPAGPTCMASGTERVYDWFASSFCLSHGVASTAVLDGYALHPHRPVLLRLQDLRPDALVQVLVRPGRFPDVEAANCRAHEDAVVQVFRRSGRGQWQAEPCTWSWEAGVLPHDLPAAVCEWVEAVEGTLVGIHDIQPDAHKRFLGRAAGPRRALRPMSAVAKREYRFRHSELTHAIRQALDLALQRLAADRSGRWRLSHESWYSREAERISGLLGIASAAAREEEEAEQLDFDTSGWNDLVGHAGVLGHVGAIAELQRRLYSSQRRDGGISSARWRAWAKVVDPDTGMPLAGMIAIGQLEANWQALWQQEGFKGGADVCTWDVQDWTLPPITLDMFQAGSLFLDIVKFYENLRHDVLWSCAIEHNFNLRLLRGLLAMYQAPRFICFAGLVSDGFCSQGTVLAGCACATTLAKLPLLGPLRAVSSGGRLLVMGRNVVDDVALQALGTRRLVVEQLGGAGAEMARQLGAMHLPLSAKKSVFLASCSGLAQELGEYWGAHGIKFERVHQARNLGTDASITMRGVREGRGRAHDALQRARRLRCLRAAGVEVDLIHKAGPTSSMVWGRTVTGVADGELHSWRVTACRSAGRLPRGAALGLRLRCAELRRGRDLDPFVLITDRSLQMLAGLLHSGELSLPMLRAELEAAASRHATATAPWVHCSSPIDAAVLTLGRIGWYFRSERCLITDVGDELDLTLLGPRELGIEAGLGARRASDRHEMLKLAYSSSVQGSLFWDAFRELIGPRGKFNERERNGLVAYLTNAHWPQVRLCSARESSHASCRCCGAARGTLWHRLFECPMLAAQRRDSVSPALMRSAVRVRAQGEAAGEDFARCWLPAPPPPQGPRTDAMSVWWIRRPPDDRLNGKLYLDGSAVDPQFGSLRRAGWAIAQCDDDGNLIAGVYGTVRRDLCPQQTARDGEDFAVWMLVNYAGPAVEEVNIDCNGTVECLRRGLAYATGPTKVNAHLWSRSLAAFEPGSFRVNKVPAHCSWQAVLDGRLTEAQRRGNQHADRLAKLGARLHAADAQTVGEHRALAGFVQELARWVGQAAVIWQDIAEKDSDGFLESDERQRVRFADLEERAEPPSAGRPTAQQPRVESARSVASAVGLSITTAGICYLGHSLAYACCDVGEGPQELVACSRCGAYMVLGGRSGGRPKLKEPCIGERATGQRSQRRLWARGLHPGGRPRGGDQQRREKGAEIPALRLQGPLPPSAQEAFLAWLGLEGE